MRRTGCTVLALGVVLLGCGDDRVFFSSPEGRFSIAFPTTPLPTESPLETSSGPVTLHTLTASSQNTAYVVAWADYPPEALGNDVEQMFDQTRDNLVANLSGELVSEKQLEIQGQPGRAVTLRVAGTENVLEAHLVLAGGRLYQIAVVNSEGRIGAPEAERFLDSFEILAPSP